MTLISIPPNLLGVPSISGRGPVLHWLHPELPLLEEALEPCNLLAGWGVGVDVALSRALYLKLTPASTLPGPVGQMEW